MVHMAVKRPFQLSHSVNSPPVSDSSLSSTSSRCGRASRKRWQTYSNGKYQMPYPNPRSRVLSFVRQGANSTTHSRPGRSTTPQVSPTTCAMLAPSHTVSSSSNPTLGTTADRMATYDVGSVSPPIWSRRSWAVAWSPIPDRHRCIRLQHPVRAWMW